jgi:hypothetical protein
MSARRRLLEADDAEIHLKLRLSDVRRRVEMLESACLVVSDLMVSEACELFARVGKMSSSRASFRFNQPNVPNVSALASTTALERTAEAAFWWTL